MKDRFMLLIVITSFFIILTVLLIPDKTKKREIDYQNNLYTSFRAINECTNSKYILKSDDKLSNNILNLVYYNEELDDYLTYFIDLKTGRLTDFKSLIKKLHYKDFVNIENGHIKDKYPDFISNAIFDKTTEKVYLVLNNELVIYYKNVESSPKYNGKLFIKINYNEIENYLTFDHILDDEYDVEDGFSYDPNFKYIAFTFDDGPSAKNTKDIVNYLISNKAHATFFMVGNMMSKNSDIVKYVLSNNCEIGSHTYSHQNLKRISINKVAEEIDAANNIYKEITGNEFTLLRPPYGAINDKIKNTFNYSYILWNVDTEDWRYKDSDRLYNYVIDNVKDGDIVLMHDIHDSTKVAVEKILPELYVRGFKVVSVSELAKIKGITLEINKGYRSLK